MLADWRGRAARVFVDAPCSGSGTWRRSPELRWRLTPARLERHRADQARLLDIAADLVAPGGKLLYAVCSVIAREGRAQVDDFLNRNPGWASYQMSKSRSEEHTSELQSLMRISYAVFCLKKKQISISYA